MKWRFWEGWTNGSAPDEERIKRQEEAVARVAQSTRTESELLKKVASKSRYAGAGARLLSERRCREAEEYERLKDPNVEDQFLQAYLNSEADDDGGGNVDRGRAP